MRFKFSIKQLFIATTVISVLLGIAAWLELFSSDWRVLGALALYFLIYLFIVAVLFGPRYLREWKEFRHNLRRQRTTRARLETETQELLASLKSESESKSAPEQQLPDKEPSGDQDEQ